MSLLLAQNLASFQLLKSATTLYGAFSLPNSLVCYRFSIFAEQIGHKLLRKAQQSFSDIYLSDEQNMVYSVKKLENTQLDEVFFKTLNI